MSILRETTFLLGVTTWWSEGPEEFVRLLLTSLRFFAQKYRSTGVGVCEVRSINASWNVLIRMITRVNKEGRGEGLLKRCLGYPPRNKESWFACLKRQTRPVIGAPVHRLGQHRLVVINALRVDPHELAWEDLRSKLTRRTLRIAVVCLIR